MQRLGSIKANWKCCRGGREREREEKRQFTPNAVKLIARHQQTPIDSRFPTRARFGDSAVAGKFFDLLSYADDVRAMVRSTGDNLDETKHHYQSRLEPRVPTNTTNARHWRLIINVVASSSNNRARKSAPLGRKPPRRGSRGPTHLEPGHQPMDQQRRCTSRADPSHLNSSRPR